MDTHTLLYNAFLLVVTVLFLFIGNWMARLMEPLFVPGKPLPRSLRKTLLVFVLLFGLSMGLLGLLLFMAIYGYQHNWWGH